MKRYVFFTLFSLLILQSCISTNPKADYLEEKEMDGMQVINIKVPMWIVKPAMRKSLRQEGESPEMIALVNKISSIKIKTIQSENAEKIKKIATSTKKYQFEDWITVKNGGYLVNFSVKQKGDDIKQLLVAVNGDRELVFIDMKGNFTAEDISKAIQYSENKNIEKWIRFNEN